MDAELQRRAHAKAAGLGLSLRAIADAIHSLAPGRPVLLDAPATPESILHAIGVVA